MVWLSDFKNLTQFASTLWPAIASAVLAPGVGWPRIEGRVLAPAPTPLDHPEIHQRAAGAIGTERVKSLAAVNAGARLFLTATPTIGER
jgi:hypothetical protein